MITCSFCRGQCLMVESNRYQSWLQSHSLSHRRTIDSWTSLLKPFPFLQPERHWSGRSWEFRWIFWLVRTIAHLLGSALKVKSLLVKLTKTSAKEVFANQLNYCRPATKGNLAVSSFCWLKANSVNTFFSSPWIYWAKKSFNRRKKRARSLWFPPP